MSAPETRRKSLHTALRKGDVDMDVTLRRCRVCDEPLHSGADLARHAIPENCLIALANRNEALEDRLERVEHALLAFLPGDRVSGRVSARPVELATCAACGRVFSKRRAWAKFDSTACRLRHRNDQRRTAAARADEIRA